MADARGGLFICSRPHRGGERAFCRGLYGDASRSGGTVRAMDARLTGLDGFVLPTMWRTLSLADGRSVTR
jgi:hypothetical protein